MSLKAKSTVTLSLKASFNLSTTNWSAERAVLIEPYELFNILNSREKDPRVCDPDYLLLLDARKRDSYDAAHIILAQHVQQLNRSEFEIPCHLEVECKSVVVVYDGASEILEGCETKAVVCARSLWSNGCRNTIRVLRGGYRLFSKLYPFLRQSKVVWLPRELDDFLAYPVEVLPRTLFLGDWTQGNDARVQKNLKITAYVNCCRQERNSASSGSESVLHIAVEDSPTADLHSQFDHAARFIDSYDVVCIFSRNGVSRAATLCVAYLMIKNKIPLKRAYKYVQKCQAKMKPNRGFIEQLSALEESLLGFRQTLLKE